MLRVIFAVIGLIVSGIFLANPTMGFIEIPDNFPIVGNLDEVFFSGVFFYCLGLLGINIMPHSKPKPLADEKNKAP